MRYNIITILPRVLDLSNIFLTLKVYFLGIVSAIVYLIIAILSLFFWAVVLAAYKVNYYFLLLYWYSEKKGWTVIKCRFSKLYAVICNVGRMTQISDLSFAI